MRVFITGGTGFVGGALTRALVSEGAEVHALVRTPPAPCAFNDLAVTFHRCDISRPETLKGVFAGADWIIHAAGVLGKFGIKEQTYQQMNVEGVHNVLAEALLSGGEARVLHISSPGVLGPTKGVAGEEAPYLPSNPYERSKAIAEQIAREFAVRGLAVMIARPGFVYGPGDRHVLGIFSAIRGGRFFYIDGGRSLCHPVFIADAVAGMRLCLTLGRPGEIYHILGPAPVTFREFAETFADALGVRRPWLSLPRWLARPIATGSESLLPILGLQPPLTRTAVDFFSQDRVFCWQKARQELDYVPQTDLATGAVQTVAWYRQHGWL